MGVIVKYGEEWHKKNRMGYMEKDVLLDFPSVSCSCGCDKFRVHWVTYPYTGGYCKIACAECGNDIVLIDDYA